MKCYSEVMRKLIVLIYLLWFLISTLIFLGKYFVDNDLIFSQYFSLVIIPAVPFFGLYILAGKSRNKSGKNDL